MSDAPVPAPLHRVMRHRWIGLVALNLLLFSAIWWLSFELRFDFDIPSGHWQIYLDTLLVLLAIKSLVFHRYGLHQGMWRYVSITDLERIIQAAIVSTLVFVVVAFLGFPGRDIARSVLVIDFLLTILVLGGVRFGVRMFRETYRPQRRDPGVRVLVVGPARPASRR